MMNISGVSASPHARPLAHVLLALALAVAALFSPFNAARAQTGDVGYRDFAYPPGTGGNSDITSDKPESKLWWNDGYWWGSLWSTAGNAYHIFRFDLANQKWIDTGVALDDRNDSKADTLWDGSKLYVASHIFVENGGAPAPGGQRGEVYRYSYNKSNKTYSLDAGFPVEVTGGRSETLVIEKDSSGTLWVTYVENSKVMVNHSLGSNDLVWGSPYALPAGGAENVSVDDISSLISYDQFIGVMWSNQNNPKTMYFAVHPVNTSDSTWVRVRAFSTSGDDHINLKKLHSDDEGNVFAVIKTADNSELIMLLVCKITTSPCRSESDWQAHVVYDSVQYNPTRPMMMIDETNRHVYVFTRNEYSGSKGGIYYKRASLDDLDFPSGIGTPFILNSVDTEVNDPTSTRQNVNAETGLLILASDNDTYYYLHNYLSLGGSVPMSVSGFSPASGPVGTVVTVTGNNLSQATGLSFNGEPGDDFKVLSNTQVRATVPPGATSGPITVTGPSGSVTSGDSFNVESQVVTLQYFLSFVGVSP